MVHKIEMPKELQVGLIAGDAVESAKWRLTHGKNANPEVAVIEAVEDFVKSGYCPSELKLDVINRAKKYMREMIDKYGYPK